MKFWLGDDASLDTYLRYLHVRENAPADQAKSMLGIKLFSEEEDEDEEDRDYLVEDLVEKIGSVGVITIDGPLVAEESFWNLLFGMVGYPTIARAAEQLANDPEVDSIVYSISSGGGDSQGISDVTSVLDEVGKIKPTYAWTGSMAGSAAYWLATSAGEIRADRMGLLGSVGAVSVLASRHRQLKEAGIDAKVIRSGKYKALGHPVDPLSKEAEAEIQKRGDRLYDFFLERVIETRPVSIATKDDWAEGRMHFADEAIQLNLADGPLISLGDLIASLDTTPNNETGDTQMPKSIVLRTTVDRAKLEAGVPLESLEHEEVEEEADPLTITDDEADGQVETSAADPGPTPEPTATEEAQGLVRYLRDELKEVRAENASLSQKLRVAEDLASEHSGSVDTLLPIVRAAVTNREIALGHHPSNVSMHSVEALAAMYDQLDSELKERYKVGRQSLSGEEGETKRSEGPIKVASTAATLGITRN